MKDISNRIGMDKTGITLSIVRAFGKLLGRVGRLRFLLPGCLAGAAGEVRPQALGSDKKELFLKEISQLENMLDRVYDQIAKGAGLSENRIEPRDKGTTLSDLLSRACELKAQLRTKRSQYQRYQKINACNQLLRQAEMIIPNIDDKYRHYTSDGYNPRKVVFENVVTDCMEYNPLVDTQGSKNANNISNTKKELPGGDFDLFQGVYDEDEYEGEVEFESLIEN